MQDKNEFLRSRLIVSKVSKKDWNKIRNDLHFVERMTKLAKEKGCRLLVSGGYAVDGSLGQITRPHNDIDIQIFGQRSMAGELVVRLVSEVIIENSALSNVKVEDRGQEEHYHAFFAKGGGLSSDIYYIQVTGNPFDDEKIVIKKDGSQTNKQRYDTIDVMLEGVTFEAIKPVFELIDKIYKREIRGDKPKPKHEQDIENLKLITDPTEVESRLAKMK